tara:strand:- start:16726 stop:18558 length:1833 start_codon:yes stop_codon:yes gene_type:complete
MLEKFRKISHGWLAWVIFGVIAVVFALFGIEGLRMGSGSSDTVTIGGETISKSLIRSMEKYFPKFNAERAFEISSKLDSLGFFVTEDQINDAIVRLPVFQNNGDFSVDLYKQVMGIDPNYLYGLRKIVSIELKKQQLADLFLTSSELSSSSINKAYELFNESRNAQVLNIPYGHFITKVKVSDEEIKNYYEKNKATFIEPEKIKLEYVLFDKKDLVKNIQITNVELLNYYEQNKSQYSEPERREVAQIVLSSDNQKDLSIIEKALAKNSNDFSDLAKKYSNGINAQKGGNIGYFQQNDMEDKALNDAIFSITKKGSISKPVISDHKIYIFKLLSIKPLVVKPFSDVKQDIQSALNKEYVNNKFIERRDEIANKIYEIPDSLNEAAKEYQLPIFTTEWLSKNNFDIKGSNKTVFQQNIGVILKSAFSEDVLQNGNNSELLELSNDKIMALRVLQHQESKQLDLISVKSIISEELKSLKAKNEAKNFGLNLDKEINSGKSSIKSIANANKDFRYKLYNDLKWFNLAYENDSKIPASLIDKVFSMSKPKLGSNIQATSVFQDENGDVFLVVLDKVTLANPNEATKKQLEDIKVLLTQSKYMIDNSIFWNSINN